MTEQPGSHPADIDPSRPLTPGQIAEDVNDDLAEGADGSENPDDTETPNGMDDTSRRS
jgi:hypothetical protein